VTNINLPGTYVNGQTADGADVQADFDAIETFINTTGVHVYQAGTVAAAALASDAVTTAKIAASAVTTAKINDLAVTTGKINDLAVTTGKLADDAVTTAKILNANVTTAKIAAGAVTFALMADDAIAPRNFARVAAVADANVNTAAPGTSTFGGATAASGEVVLLSSQSTASQNGPWVFNGSGSAMTRPSWYDGSGDAFEGFEVVSLRGTYAGRKWRQFTTGTITIDTTSTVWQMVGYMDAGNTASRPAIALVADGGIYVDSQAGVVYYSDAAAWTSLPIATGSVADGAITTGKLADASVTDEKLADDAVAPRNLTRVVAVHTSNINTSNPGTSTFGGTTVVDNAGDGEFVLLVGQSTGSQNGPWQFNGSGAALTRPSWYDSSLDGFEGMHFDVARGDWAGTRWRLTTTGTITVNTTSTAWQALDYVGRGVTGSKPAATLIAAGGLYFDTTVGQLQRSDGSSWVELIDITDLTDHISDPTGAHPATAVSVDSSTLVGTGTDVQAVFEELDNAIADHLADPTAAHPASAISFSPASGIASTDVQAAIVEAIADWQATYNSLNIGKVYDFGGPASQIPPNHVAAYGQDISRTDYPTLFGRYCPVITSSATATASNDRITATAHGLAVGDSIFLESIGSGGAGLVANAQYYVASVVDANNITISTTRSVTLSTGVVVGGGAVNITSDGSNIVLRHAPHGIAGTTGTPVSTTFKVPDLRRLGTIGLGNMGGSSRTITDHQWSNVLGMYAGEAAHLLTTSESGQKAVTSDGGYASWVNAGDVIGVTDVAHSHGSSTGYSFWTGATTGGSAGFSAGANRFTLASINNADLSLGWNPYYLNAAWGGGGYQSAHTHAISGSSAASVHNVISPNMMVPKIIYTGGVGA